MDTLDAGSGRRAGANAGGTRTADRRNGFTSPPGHCPDQRLRWFVMGGDQRDRVEAIALGLFVERGYDEVTTVEIAEAAGISPRTFFRYFPTKLDALLGDVDARTDEFAIALHRQPQGLGLIDALIATIASTTPPPELAARDLQRGLVLRDTPSLAGSWRQYEERLEHRFADWIAQRTRRSVDDFDVRVVAALLVGARRAVILEWLETSSEADVVELARRALGHLDLHVIDTAASGEPPGESA